MPAVQRTYHMHENALQLTANVLVLHMQREKSEYETASEREMLRAQTAYNFRSCHLGRFYWQHEHNTRTQHILQTYYSLRVHAHGIRNKYLYENPILLEFCLYQKLIVNILQ